MRLRVALTSVLVTAVACGQDGDFECVQDQECVSGSIAGVCQSNNYCSFPDPACESGQRYGQLAPSGFAEQCVPSEVASASGPGSSGASSGPASSASSTSGVEPPADGSGAGAAESGTVDDSCVEVDLGSELGMVDARTFSAEDDDRSPSCVESDGNDVVYLFNAPVVGEYRFRAVGQLTSVVVSLWESCSGSELVCGDNVFDPFSSTVTYALEQGEPIIVSVDTDEGEEGEFALEILLVTG